jgi:hypothetical protein
LRICAFEEAEKLEAVARDALPRWAHILTSTLLVTLHIKYTVEVAEEPEAVARDALDDAYCLALCAEADFSPLQVQFCRDALVFL